MILKTEIRKGAGAFRISFVFLCGFFAFFSVCSFSFYGILFLSTGKGIAKMKILITTDVYAPAVNGVVTSIINLEKELSVRGHEVRVLTLSQKGGSYKEGQVYYIRSLDAGKVYPGARVAFFSGHHYLNELIEWKPDVIHSQCEFTSLCYAKKLPEKQRRR